MTFSIFLLCEKTFFDFFEILTKKIVHWTCSSTARSAGTRFQHCCGVLETGWEWENACTNPAWLGVHAQVHAYMHACHVYFFSKKIALLHKKYQIVRFVRFGTDLGPKRTKRTIRTINRTNHTIWAQIGIKSTQLCLFGLKSLTKDFFHFLA